MLNNIVKWIDSKEIDITLPFGDVHVWKYDYSTVTNSINRLYEILSDDERNHAAKFKYENYRNDYIVARGTLRTIISRYLNLPAEDLVFLYNEYGKPYLSLTGNSFHFNLSHSANVVLYIFSRSYEVGIDIEKIHIIENMLEIAKQFFVKSEYNRLLEISDDKKLEAFFNCWTRKEAFVKALGNGLSIPLDQFEVSLDVGSAKLHRVYGNFTLANEWSLYTLRPCHNYQAAFCFKGNCNSINYIEIR